MLADKISQWRRILLGLNLKVFPRHYHSPVIDYFKKTGKSERRALIVYRSLPFLIPKTHPIFRCHQSMDQALTIAKILDGMGFVVDVADYTCGSFRPQSNYDLVVSHNAALDPNAAPWRKALKVYLASGTEHIVHNARQRNRLREFEARVGQHDIELLWDTEEMPWTERADAIFCFGNDTIAETWRSRFNCPVFAFQNTVAPSIEEAHRDWRNARNEFLFLGSRQQLAKGLDLLIEVFSQCPDLNLHICGHYRRDAAFCKAYRHALRLPNIHGHGWVDMGSRKMERLAAKCGFAITATCAEGSPGSITNMMQTGMVAMVPAQAGLDFGRGVLPLDTSSIAVMRDAVRHLAGMDVETLEIISAEARRRASEEFSAQAFSARWRTMLKSVLNGGAQLNQPRVS